MATATFVASGPMRCRKCRFVVLNDDKQILDEDGDDPEATTVWKISDDPMAEWIAEKVNESGWTKGKLTCPACEARLGSFDFVHGGHPIHIVKSKVDYRAAPTDVRMSTPRQAPPSGGDQPILATSSGIEELRASGGTPDLESPSSTAESSTEESSHNISTEATTTSEGSTSTSSSSSNSPLHEQSSELSDPMTSSSSDGSQATDHDDEFLTESDSDEVQMRIASKRQKNKRRLKRRRKEISRKERLNKKLAEAEEKKLKEILEADAALDLVDDDLICPVCLDLLHEPFGSMPCKHRFCEPCLRRLGSKNPMNTLCPMCRSRIMFCEPLTEISRHIRENYKDLFQKRKKFERSTNVYSLPLPWRPGWRNLISGRPMGGNRFPGETYLDYFQRCLQQLPYYVPPVVIANLINLLLFFVLLGFLELIPFLLNFCLGRNTLGRRSGSLMREMPAATIAGGSGSGEGPVAAETGGETESPAAAAEDTGMDEIALPPTYMPPEQTTLGLDVTFTYILMFILGLAAMLGRLVMIDDNVLFGLLPAHAHALVQHLNGNRRLNRAAESFIIMFFVCVVLLPLPSLIPRVASASDDNDFKAMMGSAIMSLSDFMDTMHSLVTVPTVFIVMLMYWLCTIYFDFGEEDVMVA